MSVKRVWPVLCLVLLFITDLASGQGSASLGAQKIKIPGAKPISKDLFGVFFEDLSYAADGGMYAELIQNRSFEYSASDRKNWNPLTAWEYTTEGYGYGTISVETAKPLHPNNPHYVQLNIDDAGQQGVGITNAGYDGISIIAGQKYDFSIYVRQISANPVDMQVQLRGDKGAVYGTFSFQTQAGPWKKYTGTITATANADSASLTVLARQRSVLAIDEVSLFPHNTFKNEPNGLRADLAQAVANLQPKFLRFPGGCLVHGDGINNIYRWKNTIGPVERRVQQRNIWNYHQSTGLGFYEYFRFCEDIGAKPLPVVAAGVSCQNSGGTWRIGGTGQKGIPLTEMKSYIQDVLDLIEYANGPVTSVWGSKRATAGHPKPFNLQYVGIGNEDKQTNDFRDRFKMIYDAVRAKHPEITIVGTVGPSPAGEDYDLGWKFADQLSVPVVDEHFYEKPEWFLKNNNRYDSYRRPKSKVYIGEYASWGNTLVNALSEAAFMTSLERNGDIVQMASYAPLLANLKHTSWNPNLIYFNNKTLAPTVNYYVQQLFSANQGDVYIPNAISFNQPGARADSTLAASCVQNSKTGDIILKIVNAGPHTATASANLAGLGIATTKATIEVLQGQPSDKNTIDNPKNIVPSHAEISVAQLGSYAVPPYSLSVIRISLKGN
ncbi:alpha-L-arabinofuranosidase C-terminal domain-containing protein [Mucilaginibacter ginsenosidivorax]|uniref:non-reducing end alpha-L-arabinofuranosidase n=1 Tax=Mucilaginibacter ginsenosidivorax TaxID=862126 RepID=A0A5B8W3N7_9SPHI|nr:alpha-L-arabinofuranosidase C-terminal domain-containing protein [Mucilaginibacter ginsenosidivorax]QEC77562.1 alpha-N-arabinofuranosidase [Mucilaginibacter ginsenosidivorax]